jgi:hypothetical protein
VRPKASLGDLVALVSASHELVQAVGVVADEVTST